MLNKETFTKGITVLQKIYLNWTFNSKDPLQMQIWYESFEGLNDDDFMRIIKTFCRTRIKAPGCPNDVLMILAEEEEQKWPEPDKAFNQVRELIRDFGWQYGREDIYAAISDNPALTKTVKDMESDLRELTTDDTYTPERFRRAYAINLKAMCLRNRDDKLRLATKQHEVIESKVIGKSLTYEN